MMLGILAGSVALAVLARPRCFQVEGLSMAPGLLPGDVVRVVANGHLLASRQPRRFERWIVAAPDGSAVIKRVVGLPGEVLSIAGGDLAIDGQPVVTPPTILAETAVPVPDGSLSPEFTRTDGRTCRWSVPSALIYDEAAFAPQERRLLLPVHDVGLAASVRLAGRGNGSVRLCALVDRFVVRWIPESPGTFVVVAGRLDGRFVAACWRNDPAAVRSPRSCLPASPPASWQAAVPWPHPQGVDDASPRMSLWISRAGEAADVYAAALGEILDVRVWRDGLHRPAADGREEWRLGPDDLFVLGDFSSGSRDSRHWGPLSLHCARDRVVVTEMGR